MSINVTVSGNPISIRRGKMVLSDLENIKRSEKEHRKRLRLEQVQEQSRALSKRLLERARKIEQEQLHQLDQDANTEMKKAHDRRLMEIHRRYQDIENIGYAHENAAKQPDMESIRRAEEQRNKVAAKERGMDAIQRLQESNKVVSPCTKKQERLQKVRDLEKERSKMVAQLPKKSCTADLIDTLENENVTGPASVSSSKRKTRCSVPKKSPVKKTSKSKKVPQISVTINDEETNRTPTTSTTCMDKRKASISNKLINVPKIVSDNVQETNRNNVCESDDNEPRKTVPVISTVCGKPDQRDRYSICSTESSTISTTSSSSISDDSSYFSDNASKPTTVKKTSRHHTSPVSSKVSLYDHKTRQRNEYSRPAGLVERMNIKNQPNAEDLAQEIIRLESEEIAALASQKENSRQRSKDAILRENIRRDYQALCKKIDELSKEERKLKANQISSAANEQILPPSKKNENLAKRQKKMDRAFQTILRSSRDPAASDCRVERPITITPRDYIHSNTTSVPAWSEPACADDQEIEESYSEDDSEFAHKRKISELLTKIEKLKRKLLQEYGADLPDDVFNASVKSFFNRTSSTMNQEKCTNRKAENNTSKSVVKEIQVINMSSCDENNIKKPVQKVVTDKNKKVSRCQTPAKGLRKAPVKNIVSTRDQEIQVELKPEETKDEKMSHPLEPEVKIVTPKNADSSASNSSCSNSSTATDLVVDVSKTEITVIPRERESSLKITKDCSTSSVKSTRSSSGKQPVKISFDSKKGGGSFEVVIDAEKKEITFSSKKKKTEASSRKLSPITYEKCQSLPGSRTSSPVKKVSRSAPSSRHSSPKKQRSQPSKEQINFEEQRYRTQCTQVSIDSSTESSQFNSTSENGNGKCYSKFQTLATRRFFSKLQDTSDTSTTYASPPAAAPGALLSAMNSSTPILELLDSSANESIKYKRIQVSPVSSPETPSPRTMRLPSNIPKADTVCKSLKFTSLINTQTRPGSNVISRSTRTMYSMSKDKPAAVKSPTQGKTCSCKNPACKLIHDKLEDTQAHTLKHCPEILKKYEDLQNVCTERIASLTDLIQKVRNEQKGLELSMIKNEDSNSASQTIPNFQCPVRGDMSQVVKNVEAIYAELKRTLLQSRKIISGEGTELPKPTEPCSHTEKSPSLSLDFSKDSITSGSLEDVEKLKGVAIVRIPAAAPKPKILSDERVKVNLCRFRRGQISKDGAKEATETCRSPRVEAPVGAQEKSEDMVEKLSKEILEQSKSIDKSVPLDNLKDSDDSLLKLSQPVVKDSEESSKLAFSNEENSQENKSDNLEMSNSDFIPLLAGIPKIARPKGSTNSRGRPPVTLISGPYRQEIDSPAHELSTIIEFDTPDTVNKSQVSHKSPSNKCRKKLLTGEPSQPTSSQSKKTDSKSAKSKPSVRVCPLPANQSPQVSLNFSNKSTQSAEKSPRKSIEKSLELLEKKRMSISGSKKNESSDSMQSLPDVHIEQLQHSHSNTEGNYECRISQISELHSLPDETIEQMFISEICEESKSKSVTPPEKPSEYQQLQQEQEQEKGPLTSTSSTSISGMSGVSEITSSPASDQNLFKCPSSPEEMELYLKKWGLGWAIPTLKKTREASALGSSSSSDVTPVNTATKLVSPVKKHQDATAHDLPEISDVSSISIKHANKSTEQSVLVKGRTSTPNRLSCTNSDGTVSTLGSFDSDFNIVVPNQSADITVPNISFSNNNLA